MTQPSALTVPASLALMESHPIPEDWRHHHLLGLEHLTASEITLILDYAEALHRAT